MATGGAIESDRLEKLTCTICLEVFRSPRLLPCHHTFCLECLQDLASRHNSRAFPCHTCRRTTRVPAGGVEKLQVNFYLEDDAKDARRKLADIQGRQPSFKRHHPAAPRRRDLKDWLDWVNTDDNQEAVRAQLYAGILMDAEGEATNLCKQHPDEKLRFVCLACDGQVICRDCKLTRHEGHRTDDLNTHFKLARHKLTDFSQRVKQQLEVAKEKSRVARRNQKMTMKKKQVIVERVKTRAAYLMELVCTCCDQRFEKTMKSKLDKSTNDAEQIVDLAEKLNLEAKGADDLKDPDSQLGHVVNVWRMLQGRDDELETLIGKGRDHTYKVPYFLTSKLDRRMLKEFLCSEFQSAEYPAVRISVSTSFVGDVFDGEGMVIYSICPLPGDADLWVAYGPGERESAGQVVLFEVGKGQKKNEAIQGRVCLTRVGDYKVRVTGEHVAMKVLNSGQSFGVLLQDGNRVIKSVFQDVLSTRQLAFSVYQKPGSECSLVSEKALNPSSNRVIIKKSRLVSLSRKVVAFDANCRGTLFAVVHEDDTRVYLYGPGSEDPLAKYDTDHEGRSPRAVCFYEVGGQEMLAVADWGCSVVYLLNIEHEGLKFEGLLGTECPDLLTPTALAADKEGRLWIGCQGGKVFRAEPATDTSRRQPGSRQNLQISNQAHVKLKEAEKENAQLQQQVRHQDRKIARLERDLEWLRTQSSSAKKDQDRKRKALQDKLRRQESVLDDNKRQREEVHHLEGEMEQLKKLLNAERHQKLQTGERVSELLDENELQEQRVNQLEEEKRQLQEELNAERTRHKESEELFQQILEENEQQKKHVHQLEEEKEKIQVEAELAHEEEREDTDRVDDQLAEENKRQKGLLDDFEQRNRVQEARIAELSKDNIRQEKLLDDYKQQQQRLLHDFEQQKESLYNDFQQLKRGLLTEHKQEKVKLHSDFQQQKQKLLDDHKQEKEGLLRDFEQQMEKLMNDHTQEKERLCTDLEQERENLRTAFEQEKGNLLCDFEQTNKRFLDDQEQEKKNLLSDFERQKEKLQYEHTQEKKNIRDSLLSGHELEKETLRNEHKQETENLLDDFRQQKQRLAEEHKQEKEVLLDNFEQQKETLVNEHKQEKEALVNEHKREKEAILNEHKQENEALLDNFEQQKEALVNEHKREKEAILNEHKQENEALLDNFEQQKEALVNEHKQEKEANLENFEQQKEALVNEHKREKETLLDGHKQEKEALLDSFEQEKELLVNEHKREKDALLENFEQQKEAFVNEHKQEKETLLENFEQQKEALVNEHKQEKETLLENFEQQKEALVNEHKQEKETLLENFEQQKEAFVNEHKQEKEALLDSFEQKKELLVNEHKREKDALLENFEQQKEAFVNEHKQEKEALLDSFEQQKELLVNEHKREKNTLLENFEQQKQMLVNEHKQEKEALLDSLKQQKEVLVNEHKREKETLLNEHEREKEALVNEHQQEKEAILDNFKQQTEVLVNEHKQEKQRLENRVYALELLVQQTQNGSQQPTSSDVVDSPLPRVRRRTHDQTEQGSTRNQVLSQMIQDMSLQQLGQLEVLEQRLSVEVAMSQSSDMDDDVTAWQPTDRDDVLCVGERVMWPRDGGNEYGTVRWIGVLEGDTSNEIHAGVEFDNCIGSLDGDKICLAFIRKRCVFKKTNMTHKAQRHAP
ncbi:hypothetical protein BaRGS_00025435 [Batillaria attramentaria]|uniref:RING-type domain-containing protein n=1 Tax=Batillaria attramentaria TaxID=370345 RepID=A0ABD0K870_9CAEN